MRRLLIALVLLSTARGARADSIVTPGPPAVPADYLKVSLSWQPTTPGYVRALLIGGDGIRTDVSGQDFWVQREANAPPQYRGWVNLQYPSFGPPPLPLEMSLDLAPEIDANLASVDVVIGEPVIGRARPITLSGAGGYSRTYFAIYVPEPGTLSLMAAGCMLLRRRRGRRAD